MPAGETITSTYTSGLILTGTGTNTYAFGVSATVANTGGSALSAVGAYTRSIQNAGVIRVVSGTAGSGGIVLRTASIANAASGQIAGYTAGIYVAGTGTVSNLGTISSSQTAGSGYGYNSTDRTATIQSAAIMLGSGSVTNSGSGVIDGALGGVGMNGAGVVTNASDIIGGQFGVFLDGGGSVSNAATGTIDGGTYAIYGGIRGPLTVVNQGYIYSAYGLGVELFDGGVVSNASGGTIVGGQYAVRTDNAPSTIFNAGWMYGTAGAGAVLGDGGQLSNVGTGIVYGILAGVAAFGSVAATVTNAGSIGGYVFGVVAYSANAQITNSGTITSQEVGGLLWFGGAGVALQDGGSVTNASGGLILARWIGVEIGSPTASAVGTIVNQGDIFCSDGTYGAAVWLHGSGVISNSSSGKIEGGPFGIVAYYATTLIDSGYIVGTSFAFDAVNPGYQQRVILNPGAEIVGTVYGGNPIGGSVVSTLELASGTNAGTLSGIGTQFIGFGDVIVDSGARWTLTGANTVLSGATLVDSGTLTNVGSETGGPWLEGGTIINAAHASIRDVFAAVYEPSGIAGGMVVNAGLLAGPASAIGAGVVLFSGGTVINTSTGTITGSDGIYMNGAGTTANAGTVTNAGRIVGSVVQGVELDDGGSVTNGAGATIVAALNAIVVQFQNAAEQSAMVVNQGLVAGGDGYGVLLASPGSDTLINKSGGIIVGGQGGAYVAAGATVVNAGSIGNTGTGNSALVFGAGLADRLILYPGASFAGTVSGGNTLGGTALSTLELASAATAGTLTGLGAEYVDFGQIVTDAGSNWTIAGSTTLSAGQTLANQGTLTAGGALIARGSLINSAGGTIVGNGVVAVIGASTGSVVNNGLILGQGAGSYGVVLATGGAVTNATGGTIRGSTGIFAGGGATVVDAGTITGGIDAIVFGATGSNLLVLQPGYALNGAIGGFVHGDTIEVAGITVTGSSFASGILTLFDAFGTVSLDLAGNIAAANLVVTNAGGDAVVTVLPLPPTIGGAVAGETTTDLISISPFSNVVIADPNPGQTETVTVTLSAIGDGSLNGSGSGSFNAATGVYTVTGTAAAVTTVLNELVFTPRAHQVAPGQTVTTTFTIQDTDTNGESASDSTTTVVATAVASPLTIGGAVSGQKTGDTTPIAPFSNISIADPNFGQTETVTIALSNPSNGVLGNPGIGSYNPSTGTYTVTGSASAVTAAVDALVFTPTAHQVAPGQTVTTTFTIKDTDTAAVIATDSNTTVLATAASAPINIAGTLGGQTTNDATTLTPFSNVAISDPNFGQTETATVTLSAMANGILSDVGIGSYNASTGTYTVSGSAAAVSAAIKALVFTPTAHQVAPGQTVTTTFTIKVTDTAAISVIDNTTTVIATASSAPVTIAGTMGGQTTNDATTLRPLSKVTITDPNFGQTETVTVTLSAAANGSLTGFATGSFNAASGVYSVTGTTAAVTAALDSLTFVPTPHQVAPGETVATTFTILDTDTAAIAASNNATTVVTTAVAGPITIGGAISGRKISDMATLTPFSKITIADPNFGQTETVTVTLSNPANGALSNSNAGSYNALTGIYAVTGTASAVSAAVDALVFTPSAHQVAPGQAVTTTFTIQDTDTNGESASDSTTTVIATAVASPLTIGGAVSGQKIGDTTPIAPFSNISIADPNFGQTETVTIALSNPSNGVLGNPGIGSYNPSTGTYTVTGSASAVTAAVDALVFTPTAHQVAPGQTVSTTFTIKDTDTAAVIATDSNTTVLATAASAPINIAGTLGGQTTNDATTLTPFSNVAISDPNFGQTETATVTLSATANGILSDAGIGSYNASTGTYTVSGSAAAVSAAIKALVFTPTAHQVNPGNTVVTTFTIKDTDTSAVVANDSITTVTATALAGPTTIAGTVAGQKTNDRTPVSPFSGVTITDPNASQTETATVTLSAAGNGSLGNLGTGSYNAGTGVYMVSGTAAAVTSAIDGLVFTPTQHLVALGQSFATTFTIADTDTAGSSATDSTTTVVTTAIIIESASGTSLVLNGNRYAMWNSSGAGPTLMFAGSPVTAGEFGAIAPIAAAKTATGYEIAWKVTGVDEYVVWDTDANGNYVSSATGDVSGTNPALEALEPSFGFDLNGDGTVGLKAAQVIETNGSTSLWLVGNEYVLAGSSGTGPTLKFAGSPVTAGEFGAIAPIALAITGTGYEIGWKVTGASEYVVWYTDANGNYLSSPIGEVTGQSFALEDLEPSFGFDLNGDGRLSTQLITTGPTVDLTGQSQAVTINLGSDTASASTGLSAPSLTFVGTPDAITLGTGASIVEYALQPSSGIETVAGFVLGTDELNIDLAGAANSALEAFATTVNGNAAIAVASSADLSHGIVLLNVSGGLTAANLLASHTTFVGGHALIS